MIGLVSIFNGQHTQRFGKMSYGAPWEQGVGTADLMPQCDMEVPGLVPDAGRVELNTKEAQRHRSSSQCS